MFNNSLNASNDTVINSGNYRHSNSFANELTTESWIDSLSLKGGQSLDSVFSFKNIKDILERPNSRTQIPESNALSVTFGGQPVKMDWAGNTLNNAKNITLSSTTSIYKDWVGSTDTNDYYRFSLANTANLNLSLTGLSANADIQLLDSNGSVLTLSTNAGSTAENITTQLATGTYYLRVFPASGSTNYDLAVSATSILDNAGNTLSNAKNITVNSTPSSYQDWVGFADTNDYYRFSLTNTTNLSLSLTGLSANADIQLLDINGSLVASSTNTGITPESITAQLAIGTYFINVLPNLSSTNYNLTVSATNIVSDWFSQNLYDAELISTARTFAVDNNLSRTEMISLFRNAEDSSVIDSTELTDLRTLVSNSSRFNIDSPVQFLSNNIVNGNVANQWWTGNAASRQSLGNLFAGSSAVQMEQLISKWFLGLDRPTTGGYSYSFAAGSLFQNGVSYEDIRQGQVGDCYFLASLGTTAFRTPSTIQNMFTNNGDNTFTVRFYRNGIANYVTVDSYLPTDIYGRFVFANQGTYANNSTNELWVALAEKAYAQINESGWIGQDGTNSYAGIAGGNGVYVIPQITAYNTNIVYIPTGIQDTTSIVNAFNQASLIILDSKTSNVASNVVPNHEYTLIGYNSSTGLFQLFNPWGMGGGSYQGEFKPGIIELTASQIKASFYAWSYTV